MEFDITHGFASMNWLGEQTKLLSQEPVCGYYMDSAPATEPTAWAAIALLGAGRVQEAKRAAEWLAKLQSTTGSVGVSENQSKPQWPTSLAVLVWQMADARYWQPQITLATTWILQSFARTYEFQDKLVGHDPTIPAWSWAEDTHCWVEPTSLHIMALSATGFAQDQRTNDGIRMLLDRQMDDGGCNYGNTSVLGQPLVPHIMPSGYSLMALLSKHNDSRVQTSLNYLRSQIEKRPTIVSLSFALMALATHGVELPEQQGQLQVGLTRSLRVRDSNYRRALAVVAMQSTESALVRLLQENAS